MTIEDNGRNKLPPQQTSQEEAPENEFSVWWNDKGIAARERLQRTVSATARGVGIVWSYVAVVVATVLAVVGISVWQTHEVTEYRYERPCSTTINDTVYIKGIRSYVTRSVDIFGMSLIDTGATVEVTRLISPETPTIVIGIANEGWWSFTTPDMPLFDIPMEDANLYVFHQGDDTHVVSYQDFCK